jgi:hypothetical protein
MSQQDSPPPVPPEEKNSPRRSRAAEGPAPKLARPQPRPNDGTPGGQERAADADSVDATGGSGSATGFVSMLARRQFEADQLSALGGLEGEASRREKSSTREVPMAREVPVARELPDDPVPRWYRWTWPVAVLLALVLLAIGGWGIGALLYMNRVAPLAPSDVHYPLISWKLDIGEYGGYTPASRGMAWGMLVCLPVAAALLILGWIMRGRTRRA